jgi:hypothetical protein
MELTSRTHLWDRLGNWVDKGRGRLGAITDDLDENTRVAARRARSRLRDGAEAIYSAEHSVARTVKAHPYISAIAGAGVACLLIAVLLWSRREDFSGRE